MPPSTDGHHPRRHVDWSLRSCGLHGHVTYAPDEPELARRLRADTAEGAAWRCLRCADFVVGPPMGSGPADDAPTVLRGQGLRDAFVVRLISLDKLVHGLVVSLIAFGIARFDSVRGSLQRVFDTYLPLVAPIGRQIGIDLQDTEIVRLAERAFVARDGTLRWLAAGVASYGLLTLTEAVGLWLMKRWAEYLSVIATSAFVPLEVYELAHKVTALRLAALVVNLLAVAYLLVSKRLFGIRGGRAAHEAARHESSLIEVERSAAAAAAT